MNGREQPNRQTDYAPAQRLRAFTSTGRLGYWIDLLIASDPALDHLKSGARAFLAAGISTIALRRLAQSLGQDPKLAILGIAVPMMSAVTLRDPQPTEQRRSLLLAVPVAAGANLIGSLAVGNTWLSGVLFLAAVFLAFELRRFGPRGTGLGMTGFYAYFFALLLQSSLAKIAWQTGLLCAGYAIAYLVRFLLIADHPQAVLRSMLRALRARLSALLYDLTQGLASGDGTKGETKARNEIAALNALTLQIEDHLEDHSRLGPGESSERERLRERVLDMEIAAESLANVAHAVIKSDQSSP